MQVRLYAQTDMHAHEGTCAFSYCFLCSLLVPRGLVSKNLLRAARMSGAGAPEDFVSEGFGRGCLRVCLAAP